MVSQESKSGVEIRKWICFTICFKTINALAMQSNNEFIEAIDSQMGAKMVERDLEFTRQLT